MKYQLPLVLLAAGVMTFGCLMKPAAADEFNKQTILHFNNPVEIPGHVLIPGTYVFQLDNSLARNDVVQIFSQDKRGKDHFVTNAMAIPAYRVKTPGKTIMTFEERRSDSPEAINKWFYPGDNFGWQFVYPSVTTSESPAVLGSR